MQNLLVLSRDAVRVDGKVFLAKVLNRSRSFEVVAILGQGKEDFVVDRDVAIFECLRARLDQVDLAGEDFLEEGLVLSKEGCESWIQACNHLGFYKKERDFIGGTRFSASRWGGKEEFAARRWWW